MDRIRPLTILGAGLGAAVALSATLIGLASRRYARVEVAGESMTPALAPGDYLVVRRGAPSHEVGYGAVVALRDPRPVGDGRLLLKRVVGLPGESLRIGGGPVQINGRVLIEPHAHGTGPYDQHRGINRLEPGEYFLLGDHRGASTDSRDFGPVRHERIESIAVFRYWPPGRIGRLRAPERHLAGIEASVEAGIEASEEPQTHPDPGSAEDQAKGVGTVI